MNPDRYLVLLTHSKVLPAMFIRSSRTLLIILCLASSWSWVQAQNFSLDGNPFLQGMRATNPKGLPPGVKGYGDLEGTPFLYEEFQSGTLHFVSGKNVDATINYDVFNHEVLVELKQQTMSLPHPNLQGFSITSPEGKKFEFRNATQWEALSSIDLAEGTFLRLIQDGDYTLVGEMRKNFLPAKQGDSYGNDRDAPTFKDQPERFFLIEPGGTCVKAKLRKGWWLKYAPDQADAIKAFVKQEKVDLSTAAGCARLVEWLGEQK